ncbi:condensation domain-containing protein [Cellulomonas sp. URHD0024]|uniref:condensation domain-containing protein n=1 Tax=Cellulomonas sp. URHD0024 TaxID=1302620 RepID=UPI0009DC256E|nr:condensation domain-containing protein [Cellulomonas sp. URHD0024]
MREELTGFAGEVQRSGPLHSGLCQLEWLSYQSVGDGLFPNLTWVVSVPDGVSDDAVSRAVTTVLLRHEGLRTSFDADAAGQPRQNVYESIHVAFPRIDDEHSRRLFTEDPFDVACEPPIRFGRTSEGDLIFTHAHMVGDGTAGWILYSELTELLAAAQEPRRAPNHDREVPQPLDRALYERDKGRSRAESALRFWDTTLRNFPVTALPVRRGRPGAAVVRAELESSAATVALARLHTTYAATPASIFTAAVYEALAIQFGRVRLGLNLSWSFRELPTTRDLVAAIFRDMPLLVDLDGQPSFTEVVRRLQKAILVAGRHMSFDVLGFYETAGQVLAERGTFLPAPEIVSPTLDGVDFESLEPGGDPRALRADSRMVTYQTNEPAGEGCNLYVGAFGVEGRLLIEVRLDGSVMGEDDSAALATLIESILVHAAASGDLSFTEAEGLATRRWRPEAGEARVGDLWVDRGFLSARLLEHPAVQHADVREEGDELTAYVTADIEPWQLRDFLLSTDNGRTAFLSPQQFVVRRSDGSTVAGPGTDRPALAPEGAAEHALRDAVAGANELTELRMSGTYLTVGGRLHSAPRVLSLLKDSGFDGLTVADLRRPMSLVALAGLLRRRS